jgi:hypothetical protein
LKSSGGDFKEDDLESSDKSSANSSPRMLKTKRRKTKSDMTQPMKAGCPKKLAAVKGGQMPNCSEDEDYFVAVACTNVTVDLIRGVGQKGETFWTRVHDKFFMI